ncbi:MAG: DNA-3-methyladenine glycosylase family protein [Candidatus Levyibacteriota bacterium]
MSHSVKDALNHFKKADPVLYKVAVALEVPELEKSKDYFASLCREIVGQQLSGRVARVIFDRFLNLFPKKKITISRVIKLTPDQLRATGMSWGKVSFIKDLADKVKSGKVELEKFDLLPDETVLVELVKVKGIGPWTAEMFLMFALARPDVFSYGDLGLKKGMQKVYNMKKHPTIKQAEKLSKKWSPYRTYASKILWLSLDSNNI